MLAAQAAKPTGVLNMSLALDPLAVRIFAQGGIALTPVTVRDFSWGHDCYLRSGPDTKDIEVRVYRGTYMGKIVHRETVPAVHYEHAAAVAQTVLDNWLKNNPQNP